MACGPGSNAYAYWACSGAAFKRFCAGRFCYNCRYSPLTTTYVRALMPRIDRILARAFVYFSTVRSLREFFLHHNPTCEKKSRASIWYICLGVVIMPDISSFLQVFAPFNVTVTMGECPSTSTAELAANALFTCASRSHTSVLSSLGFDGSRSCHGANCRLTVENDTPKRMKPDPSLIIDLLI